MLAILIHKKTLYKAILLICSAILFTASLFIVIAIAHSKGTKEGVFVPILMYHSILRDPSRTGKYVVTPTESKSDLQYLQSHGYSTIVINDLINYVYHQTPLPPKPVILTFDDGHYNNKTYLFPLLKKYNMRAVLSIVGTYTEEYSQHPDPNPAYAYLT